MKKSKIIKKYHSLKTSYSNLIDINIQLNKTIEMLEKQLLQQDKAIERKDIQFQGLKSAYKDDLINGLI